MAVIDWQDIGELTANDPDNIKRAIVVPTKEALRQTRFALTGNLTIKDNAYAAIVTLGQLGNNASQTLVHGTEYVFQNPLKTTPVGFTPIKAFDSNRVAIQIPDCKFNTSRTDGLMGVTPNFASTNGGSGSQGEQLETVIGFASRVTLAASTGRTNIVSLTPTAGQWDLTALCTMGTGAVTGTRWDVSIATSSLGGGSPSDSNAETSIFSTANVGQFVIVPQYRVTTDGSITYWMVVGATYSAGSPACFGRLSAVRAIPYLTGTTGNIVGILWGG